MDLSRVKDRDGLKARHRPYWQRLSPGRYLGYRTSAREGSGTWIARVYDEQGRNYRFKSLGDFAGVSSRDQFAAAKKLAEEFADLVESGGHAKVVIETVEQACRSYEELKPEAAGRFKRHIYSDPIANVKLAKLRKHHLAEWRRRLEGKPALISRRKEGEEKVRPRAASSVNRDMAILRAALNKVLPHGTPGRDSAWQEALKANKNTDGRRTLDQPRIFATRHD